MKFLNQAIYQPRDVSSQLKLTRSKKKKRDSSYSESESLDNVASDLSVSSSEEESLSEEEDDESEE